ncbi:pentapeptide repeat-containing protein [Lacrimispora brassicae]
MECFTDKNDFYSVPSFSCVNFSDVDLHMSSLRNGEYCECSFDGAKITFADLVDTHFESCTFRNVNMRVTAIGSATFTNCVFEDADLSYCSSKDTSFEGSEFINTKLEHINFVSSNFKNAKLINCSVYGISSWDLDLKDSVQKNLVITKEDQPVITVDNIELAQFIYLMINNSRLRNIIDTITSKVVLVLGNFSPQRKAVLDEIRERLRQHDFVPVMFDFEKPTSRNLTETVFTLSNMSKFVIADLSSARSIGHELSAIVPRLPSVFFYPIILKDEKEYGMFEDFSSYSWVKPVIEYETQNLGDSLQMILDDQSF